MTTAQRQRVTRGMIERKIRGTVREAQMVADRGGSLHTCTHTHTLAQTLWASNQTEAGRTAVGENEFCSLEAQRERRRERRREEKKDRKEKKRKEREKDLHWKS